MVSTTTHETSTYPTLSNKPTTISSHGAVDHKALQVYGSGPIILRLGNGGAGATGLLSALSHAYLTDTSRADSASIAWVHNHSRNTQLALHAGSADVALTYERSQEALAQAEGWSVTRGCAFHDHFVLAGPVSDPLGLANSSSLEHALQAIIRGGRSGKAVWHARVDGSATMWKERALWELIHVSPWTDEDTVEETWYQTSTDTPADALIAADKAGAYLLTDRSTLLRQTARRSISGTTVFFEPARADDILLNSCYALTAADAGDEEKAKEVEKFVQWLLGEGGQSVVENFGEDEAGLPFFARASEDFARSALRGGRPEDGKWTEVKS